MKQRQFIFTGLAVLLAGVLSFGFTPHKQNVATFRLNPLTGNLYIPYTRVTPTNGVCAQSTPNPACSGVFYLDASGNPTGTPLSVTYGVWITDL